MKLDLSQPFDLQRFNERSKILVDASSKVELTKFMPNRSINQNAYFHVLCQYVALETGYTTEDAKTMLKRGFGSFMIKDINGHPELVSSAKINSAQMTEFIDWIRLYASEEIGIYLLTADEFKYNRFEVEKELQYVK